MGCGDNRKSNCGEKVQSVCVHYKGYLPEYSELDKDCVVIEETTQELYENQEEILNAIDTSELGKDCIDFDEYKTDIDGVSKLQVKGVLEAYEKEICDLKNMIGDDNDDTLSLDFKCLTTPCGDQITSLKDLLQVLIDEICTLKGQ